MEFIDMTGNYSPSISHLTCDIKLFPTSTWKYGKNIDKKHCHFLNSMCDIGDPISEAPTWPSHVLMTHVEMLRKHGLH